MKKNATSSLTASIHPPDSACVQVECLAIGRNP
jgi:hypothetical protein